MSRHHVKLNRKRWEWVRRQVLDRDGWRCAQCGKAGRLEVDHLVPLEKGGQPYAMENLGAKCRPCHFAKTAIERGGKPTVIGAERQAWGRLVDGMLDGP